MIKTVIPQILAIKTLHNLHYTYVRKKDIDQICSGYTDSKLDKIKMYSKMFAHIGKQGFKGAKSDLRLYMKLKKIPKQQFTSDHWNQLIRIYHDFFRIGPLFIIQALPMSGPLFILYMYTYPGSIPSWFIIDKFHEQYQKRIRIVQQQAVQYFRNKNIKPENINFDEMNLQQARKLAECLYGYHRDGTLGWNKIFKKNIQYFISQGFSKYLIKRKLKYKFKADLQHANQLKDKTLSEKIKWKYGQVMVHGKLLKKYEDILTAEQLKIRQQQQNAQKSMEDQGNKGNQQQKEK